MFARQVPVPFDVRLPGKVPNAVPDPSFGGTRGLPRYKFRDSRRLGRVGQGRASHGGPAQTNQPLVAANGRNNLLPRPTSHQSIGLLVPPYPWLLPQGNFLATSFVLEECLPQYHSQALEFRAGHHVLMVGGIYRLKPELQRRRYPMHRRFILVLGLRLLVAMYYWPLRPQIQRENRSRPSRRQLSSRWGAGTAI